MSNKNSFLIPKEDMMGLPITITKQTKPKKSFIKKLID